MKSSLGRILRLGGDKDQALAAFDQAVALDPSHHMALYEQGMILAERGRTAEALVNFEKVLATRPGDPAAIQAVATLRAAMAPPPDRRVKEGTLTFSLMAHWDETTIPRNRMRSLRSSGTHEIPGG